MARRFRVWVPGCSTGQEAYSLAIVLLEFFDTAKSRRPIQIFATDLGDPAALDKARAGLYPESIEAEVSPERLRRFFTREERHYRIQKTVRDLCVFARQNVTVDPPFSRVDLVTCRNVMIYMSPPLQERLLPVFHFALNPGGFLVLGLAETVGLVRRSVRAHDQRPQDLPQARVDQPADLHVHGRRLARRHRREAAGDHESTAERLPARSRPPGHRALRPALRARQPRFRGAAVPRAHVAVPRSARAGSRRRTSCGWPGKGCSWSCAAR